MWLWGYIEGRMWLYTATIFANSSGFISLKSSASEPATTKKELTITSVNCKSEELRIRLSKVSPSSSAFFWWPCGYKVPHTGIHNLNSSSLTNSGPGRYNQSAIVLLTNGEIDWTPRYFLALGWDFSLCTVTWLPQCSCQESIESLAAAHGDFTNIYCSISTDLWETARAIYPKVSISYVKCC